MTYWKWLKTNQIIKHFFLTYVSVYSLLPGCPFPFHLFLLFYFQLVCKIGFCSLFVFKIGSLHSPSNTAPPTPVPTLPHLSHTRFLLFCDNYNAPQVPMMVFCWLSRGMEDFSGFAQRSSLWSVFFQKKATSSARWSFRGLLGLWAFIFCSLQLSFAPRVPGSATCYPWVILFRPIKEALTLKLFSLTSWLLVVNPTTINWLFIKSLKLVLFSTLLCSSLY